jgi:ketosteroid isomerase-like protein
VRWPAHSRPPLNLRRPKYQQSIEMEMTMTTDAETLVRRAYQLAEGNIDVQGFVDLFADDGEVNVTGMSFRGERLGSLVGLLATFAPDIHREFHKVVVQDNIVAVELAIRGTFTGPYESPAGVLQPNGAKLDVPGADFWVVRDGKIKQFNCHTEMNILFEQMGVQADFASAIKARAVAG